MNLNSPWQELPLAVVDTETTGLNPLKDRIIEIGILHFENGIITNTFESLVNPECALPEETVKITGITDKDVADAPIFASIAQQVHDFLKDRVLVAYNLEFDRKFMEQEMQRVSLTLPHPAALDPLVFAREIHRHDGSKKLGVVAQRLGIDLKELHRASADAELAGKILYAFAPWLPPNLSALIKLQQQWATQQEQEMKNWRSRKGFQDDTSESAVQDATAATETQPDGDKPGLTSLGPAYIFGREIDPLKALYQNLPQTRIQQK